MSTSLTSRIRHSRATGFSLTAEGRCPPLQPPRVSGPRQGLAEKGTGFDLKALNGN